MTKPLLIAFIAASLAAGPAFGSEKNRKKPAEAKEKIHVGASCKVSAIGRCPSCGIACQTGETATCAPGMIVGDVCHTQPSCRCTR
jgi:hypothetical protein